MQMTHKLHTASAEDLFEHFTGAIESGDHSAALVHAMQIMSEASEQMKVILANAQLRAALYSESAMLVHIASRRTLQSEELRVFLQEVNDRITTASTSRCATSAGFTASWVDFIAGWLSKQDTDLVEPSSLEQVTRKAQTPSAAAHGTSQHTTPPAGPTTRPAQSGVGTGGSSGTGTAGGGPGGGGGSSAAPPFQIRHNPQIPPADPVFARCDRTGPRRRWLPTAQEVQARRPLPRRMPQRVRRSWGGPGAAGGVPNSAPMTRKNVNTESFRMAHGLYGSRP
jgi:hypothetical protein